jgi:hypothetical protein
MGLEPQRWRSLAGGDDAPAIEGGVVRKQLLQPRRTAAIRREW